MKVWFRIVAVATFALVAGVAYAQTPQGPDKRQMTEERRQQLEARRAQVQQQREELLQTRKDAMQQHREQLKQQHDQMIAQRRELLGDLREFRKQLHDQVAQGQLTREQAQQQLRAWRKDHKPTPPATSGGSN